MGEARSPSGVGAKLKMSIKSIKSETRADCRGIFFGKEGQGKSVDAGTRRLAAEEGGRRTEKGGNSFSCAISISCFASFAPV